MLYFVAEKIQLEIVAQIFTAFVASQYLDVSSCLSLQTVHERLEMPRHPRLVFHKIDEAETAEVVLKENVVDRSSG